MSDYIMLKWNSKI